MRFVWLFYFFQGSNNAVRIAADCQDSDWDLRFWVLSVLVPWKQRKNIMSDVICPACKEEFDVHDHYKSGEYTCPKCDTEIWVEAEHSIDYSAYCLDSDHKWEPLSGHAGYSVCKFCDIVRHDIRLPKTESKN